MPIIETDILPSRTRFAKIKGPHQENLEAICVFIALGFFLDSDTYWKDQVCLAPASKHTIDNNGFLVNSESYFKWSYHPEYISFDTVLEKYTSLLKTIVKSQVKDDNVILPLSGGLDSRSQAMIFKSLDNKVEAYSYSFQNGFKEHKISEKIANACGFNFSSYTIKRGYLWDTIEELAEINQCYSEFTHPRQMAVLSEFEKIRGVFSLGHWGDVFFDRGTPEGTTNDDIIPMLFKKMVKKYGFELGETLWQYWELEGNFKDYLISRIEVALSSIKIDNASAKVRAFKTSQWAHRWTSTNLSVFEKANPITLPYYDNRMCEFICNVPEAFLADRKLQIAHIKQDKALSNITWQARKPFNINNYERNKPPYNLPYRISNKMKRTLNELRGKHYVQRNWELQFVGDENDKQLRSYLFSDAFNEFISKDIVEDIYTKFKKVDPIHYAHPLSMLLTLALWKKQNKN
ncbi:asparagine synthase-related protein [uncultured Psychroserpens sp.]|uniref:asparagine synthase-related protein n=1 Tax=uncultured Psychroserpens sp. TaxID=255436 RepID=UPI002613D76B|nr:asparagine synthase-related protein [uncultured Psychroserpens sp.]